MGTGEDTVSNEARKVTLGTCSAKVQKCKESRVQTASAGVFPPSPDLI